MKNTCVAAENLGKRYKNNFWGIRHLNFKIDAGTFVALVGANGAGKTTLIHLLAGVLSPTEGTVVHGINISKDIGWCSQQPTIDWFISVRDNILLGARLAGSSRKKSESETDQILAAVGLDKMGHRNPDQLSGGQQQRLQIARALVHHPQFVLLDEPTTGLDPKAAADLMQIIKTRTQNGCLAIISSHDLSLIEDHADKILFLNEGKMATYETRSDFLNRFAAHEIFKISYEGELSPKIIDTLEHRAAKITSTDPLEMRVPRGTQLAELISLFDGSIRILDVHRTTPGLKEAYFSIAEGKK